MTEVFRFPPPIYRDHYLNSGILKSVIQRSNPRKELDVAEVGPGPNPEYCSYFFRNLEIKNYTLIEGNLNYGEDEYLPFFLDKLSERDVNILMFADKIRHERAWWGEGRGPLRRETEIRQYDIIFTNIMPDCPENLSEFLYKGTGGLILWGVSLEYYSEAWEQESSRVLNHGFAKIYSQVLPKLELNKKDISWWKNASVYHERDHIVVLYQRI